MRKPRRLSLRQAIACETGKPMKYPDKQRTSTRCRCKGVCRGRASCDPVKPTRWDFSELPAADPHHIPRQRRRISPRRAVQALTRAMRRQQAAGNWKSAEVLQRARRLVDQIVRDERVASERRKRYRQLVLGQFDPAAILQHAIETLVRWGSDVEAQMLVASVKLDLVKTL